MRELHTVGVVEDHGSVGDKVGGVHHLGGGVGAHTLEERHADRLSHLGNAQDTCTRINVGSRTGAWGFRLHEVAQTVPRMDIKVPWLSFSR